MHRPKPIASGPSSCSPGCREVDGFRGPGTGYLIEGTGVLQTSGPDFEAMKARFPWMRAVLVVNPEAITQTL